MSKKDDTIAATLDLLAETFPNCFSVFEGRRRPLKVGIREDIMMVLDGAVTPQELSKALHVYVVNKVYQARLVAGAIRIDLGGNPAGTVTQEEASTPKRKAAPPPLPVKTTTTPTAPKRLSLGDLRAAARRRQSLVNAS